MKKRIVAVVLSLMTLICISTLCVNASSLGTPRMSSVSNVYGGVKVDWKGVSGADGYYVYRKTGSQKAWQRIATVTGRTKVSYTDKTIKSGEKGTYTVRAYKGKVVSKYDTTGKSRLYLSAPSVSLSATTAVSTKLSWKKVAGSSGYVIYQKSSGDRSYKRIATVNNASTLTYTAKSLKAKTKYAFVVKAYNGNTYSSSSKAVAVTTKSRVKVKIGLICIHDQQSMYDSAFLNAFIATCKAMNFESDQGYVCMNVPETEACYTAAKTLIKQGCNLIISNSFGHESYMLKAAKNYPNVQFVSISGTKAHTERLKNFHNAYGAVHEGKYLLGVAAGMKLNEMIKNKKITKDKAVLGYVGAYSYAEVISGYTAFYLGAKSVCPYVKMKVQNTGSWYDSTAEMNAAYSLISKGCVLISQYSDSIGVPSACAKKGVPNIAYNVDYTTKYPSTSLASMHIDWQPYFMYCVKSVRDSVPMPYDYTATLKTGSVKILKINGNVAAKGTADTLKTVTNKMKNGSIKVFDTSKFTVNGKTITKYKADVNTDMSFTPDTNVIVNGEFAESKFRSAPYFDMRIDGITVLNEIY